MVQALDNILKVDHYVIADHAEEEAVKTKQDMLDEHKAKVLSYTSHFVSCFGVQNLRWLQLS